MTPIFKKLNYKPKTPVVCIHSPATFAPELAAIKEFAEVYTEANSLERIDFALVFVLTQEEIDTTFSTLLPKLEGDFILWFCYPKATSKKYSCTFNRDRGWQSLGENGLEPVRQVAIDEDWSALRFRKVGFIKTLSRKVNHAISAVGKEKTRQNK